MLRNLLLVLGTGATLLQAEVPLEQKIGQMLMVGFHGTSVKPDSRICKDIRRYNLGAVILFDYNPVDKSKSKNIASKAQVAKLTKELQACSRDGKLLIAVDQEGGKVQRLKSKYGFYGNYPKAADAVKLGNMKQNYERMAQELRSVGINYDLAPVVDLDINPKNYVIHALGRSFAKEPETVRKCASIFIDAMHRYGVLTSLKHFPGHGSSVGDTHKGFVDVTNLWKPVELEPYRLLKDRADTVMVAHVFNRKLDPNYPATLSKKIVEGLLRKEIGFQGVVITDDLQMGAISKRYGLEDTLKLAINAGNDILLFGNQLAAQRYPANGDIVATIKHLVQAGEIKKERIEASYRRVLKLKSKL